MIIEIKKYKVFKNDGNLLTLKYENYEFFKRDEKIKCGNTEKYISELEYLYMINIYDICEDDYIILENNDLMFCCFDDAIEEYKRLIEEGYKW